MVGDHEPLPATIGYVSNQIVGELVLLKANNRWGDVNPLNMLTKITKTFVVDTLKLNISPIDDMLLLNI
jgi:hypothetical protein